MKYKLEATIPTTQYGNIRPVFDVTDNESEVLDKLTELWNTFGEKPLTTKTNYGKLVTSFTGEKFYYNDDTHEYFSLDGKVLLSGSAYAKQFDKVFDKEAVSTKESARTGVPKEILLKMWQLTSDVSTSFGTAVHDAVELVIMGGSLDKVPVTIRDTVDSLVKEVAKYNMVPITEVLVSNLAAGHVGRIDCLLVDDPEQPKKFRIIDYKTNRELKKHKITVYTKQLEFYRDILTSFGMECEGLALLHHDGNELTVYDV